ncbi:hypothetical protein ASPZODRAFT_71425 [Penicilliopsis zonata CBS 506.65]|uniref:Major facilitator superfamily (MFS) profile domain-containing protein n=1 Tax=Penicilliopsis zonata CBS 506.65 TaxID=1073090 RepID=A0A1L9SBL3_9EURO|nr:hypothetical protein ASPZODRAFT_71425 [Penicilliopsis zonata CBS 506.65]OJJ44543.1 hypothetical protein ASPZODRAFT_71425 [Penicilliopsis zonata CBS 506.65]
MQTTQALHSHRVDDGLEADDDSRHLRRQDSHDGGYLHPSSSFEHHGHSSAASNVDDSEGDVSTVIYDGGSARTAVLAPAPEIGHCRRSSVDRIDDDSSEDGDDDLDEPDRAPSPGDEKPVTWASLPKKGQLAIITVARLSEPLAQTSLQAYLFYQLKSFDPSLPDSAISSQAGILQGSFTAAQFVTAVWWGRLADADWMGRKRVLLIGLTGTCLSTLGFGFSRSFVSAAIFRTLGGALNSNIGVMRTMIAEITQEKKYQSRALLLLPMCFNIGVIIGPILGGMLADPVNSYPDVLGPGTFLGGKNGVWWMEHWPYALPNILIALYLLSSIVAVFLGLEETHEVARYREDWGRKLGRRLGNVFTRHRVPKYYRPLRNYEEDDGDLFHEGSVTSRSLPTSPSRARARAMRHQRPSFQQIWTRNVVLTLFVQFLLSIHTSAFNSMTFVFLPTPRAPEDSHHGFFHFGGGLGLSSSRVGLATAIIGVIGLPLQLFVYPAVQERLGTLTSFRIFLPFSPLAYALMPFLVLIPRLAWLVWPSFTVVIAIQVISRTFALPASVILVQNCVTDSTVLGTVNGFAQSVMSAARTLGPLLGGWGLGLGLANNMVGAVWWALAIEAGLGWILLWYIYEGQGIDRSKNTLEEEEEDEDEE